MLPNSSVSVSARGSITNVSLDHDADITTQTCFKNKQTKTLNNNKKPSNYVPNVIKFWMLITHTNTHDSKELKSTVEACKGMSETSPLVRETDDGK